MEGEAGDAPVVRRGTEGDLAAVLPILQAAFALHEGRIDPPSGANGESLVSLGAKLAVETLLVAEIDGAIVGCIWCKD